MKSFVIVFLLATFLGCKPGQVGKNIGEIELIDSSLTAIINSGAKAEVIAEGFGWSEGPLWIESSQTLLFSDIPENKIYQWTAAKGKELYLKPSGYTGEKSRDGSLGSNGLLLNSANELVICQHGNRQIVKMKTSFNHPSADFLTIAAMYNGKKINSPNDAVYNSEGELFFTDPSYGLLKMDADPDKEIPFNGVYKVKKDGQVVLLVDSLPMPNGIAFFPGYKKILISCTDGAKPNWYVYDVNGDSLSNGKMFYSGAGIKNGKNNPDGLKIDHNGNVFATAPGGIWIFNSNGNLLGKLLLPDAVSNCALSADEKILFITNGSIVLKFTMRK
jgi:gluconolactonase